MINSTKMLAVAALVGSALSTASLVVAPLGASANAAANELALDAGDRIGGAFASIPNLEAAPALRIAALRAAKGDLYMAHDCAGSVWPNIDRSCLVTADGSAAPAVRTITIGYQQDEATTVLVRMPAVAIATR